MSSFPLKLHATGTLEGVSYSVKGIANYSVVGDSYKWTEWRLLSDKREEAWLSYGHGEGFLLFSEIHNFEVVAGGVVLEGQTFHFHETVKARLESHYGDLGEHPVPGKTYKYSSAQRGYRFVSVESMLGEDPGCFAGGKLQALKVAKAFSIHLSASEKLKYMFK